MPRSGLTKSSGLPPDQDATYSEALKRARLTQNYRSINIDGSYYLEYGYFLRWVLKNGLQPNPAQFPYRFITRETVDAYYLDEVSGVPSRMGLTVANSLNRVKSSLQKFWSQVETCPMNKAEQDEQVALGRSPKLMEEESPEFLVANKVVAEGERLQKCNYTKIAKAKTAGNDPFKGLKLDLLSSENKRIILKYILDQRHDWKDLGCSFNLGCNAGLRGKSTRSLHLKDIAVSYGFAPRQGKSLTIILRKDDQKVTYKVDRLVGCLRHRDYLLCGVFFTAMNVVHGLRDAGTGINFTRTKKKDAEWWNKDFVKFDKIEDEQNAMSEVSVDELQSLLFNCVSDSNSHFTTNQGLQENRCPFTQSDASSIALCHACQY